MSSMKKKRSGSWREGEINLKLSEKLANVEMAAARNIEANESESESRNCGENSMAKESIIWNGENSISENMASPKLMKVMSNLSINTING